MSHFECRLNRRFWRSKKVVQVVQIGERGGGAEVIWTKSKRTAAFFSETVPVKHTYTYIQDDFFNCIKSLHQTRRFHEEKTKIV